MASPKFFICGITGNQGGAIAKHLLAQNIAVSALTRDPTSAAAQEIAKLGATFTKGSFDDADALKTALQGCTGLFLNPVLQFTDLTYELRQAQAIIAAAEATGTITTMVYSSSIVFEGPEQIGAWDPESLLGKAYIGKSKIEDAVRGAAFLKHWTILRPGVFMVNFLDPIARMYAGLVETGTWTTALEEKTVLPLVDPDTIGAFGAAALTQPERFHGQEIVIVDQCMQPQEILAKIGAVTGRKLGMSYLTDEEIEEQKKTNMFIIPQLLMRDLDQFVDEDKVKSWGLPRSTLDKFLQREKQRAIATYPPEQ